MLRCEIGDGAFALALTDDSGNYPLLRIEKMVAQTLPNIVNGGLHPFHKRASFVLPVAKLSTGELRGRRS